MQIAPHLQTIIELIAQNDVCEINAATGSGKSIGIPGALGKLGSRVFIAVPTTSAAVSLASYQKNILPSIKIGYAAEGDIKYDKDTVIVYATAGHLRRKMVSYFSKGNASPINFTDVLMVDEVHAGSVDNTVILSLWYYAYAKGIQVPKLVLASATPSPSILRLKIPRFEVKVESYPIQVLYTDKNYEESSLYTEIARLAASVHLSTEDKTASMLIFVPGANEVETVINLLSKSAAAPTSMIVPAFGAMKQEEINLIHQEIKGKRKIIVATNIAESAITIADLGIVIDSMLEKRAETSLTGGLRLATHLISKASAKQRSGRTGRTRAGTAYRMITAAAFESLEDHRPEEINRVPIYEVVMELFAAGLNPESTLLGITPSRIKDAIDLLSALSMITAEGITALGQFSPMLPLGVRNAAVLYFWLVAGYPAYPGIVAVSLIDCFGPSYFWYPRKENDQSIAQYQLALEQHQKKYFAPLTGRSDVDSFLNMWIALMDGIGGPTANPSTISKWCAANSINNKKIREVLKIIKQVVNGVQRFGYKVEVGPFTRKGVMKALKPLLRSLYGDMLLVRKGSSYIHQNTGKVYTLDSRRSINTFGRNPPKDLIGIIVAEIEGKSIIRMISCAITGTPKANSKQEMITGAKAFDALALTGIHDIGGNEGRGLIGSIRQLGGKDKKAILPLLYNVINRFFTRAETVLESIVGLTREGKLTSAPLLPEFKLLEQLKDDAIDVTKSSSFKRTNSRVDDINNLFQVPPQINMYLDVGSSEGDITAAVVDFYKLKLNQAYATDIVPMKSTSQFNFIQTDGQTLPFEKQTFNFVTIFMSAHHFKLLDYMLSEIKRVSQSGATIVLREHDVDTSYMSKLAWSAYFDFIHLCYAVYRNHEVTVEQWMFDYVNSYPYASYRSKEEWAVLFEQAGFNLTKTQKVEKDDVNFAFYQVYNVPITDAYAAIIARHPDEPIITVGNEPELASLFPPSTSKKLAVTPDGLYFMSRPDEAAAIVSVITQAFNGYDPKVLVVTDATAGMGGITFGLAAAFGTVHAVDEDLSMINLLHTNLKHLGLNGNVKLYHANYLDVMTGIAQNVIFIDIFTKGLSYEENKNINAYLGTTPIVDVLKQLITAKLAQLILVKLPNNFDFNQLKDIPGYVKLDLQRFQLAFIVVS